MASSGTTGDVATGYLAETPTTCVCVKNAGVGVGERCDDGVDCARGLLNVQGALEKSRSLPVSLPFRGKLHIGKLSSKNLHMGMWYIYTLLHEHIKTAFKCTKCTTLGMAEIGCMLAAADVHGCYQANETP